MKKKFQIHTNGRDSFRASYVSFENRCCSVPLHCITDVILFVDEIQFIKIIQNTNDRPQNAPASINLFLGKISTPIKSFLLGSTTIYVICFTNRKMFFPLKMNSYFNLFVFFLPTRIGLEELHDLYNIPYVPQHT